MTWYLPFKISIAKTDVFAIECLDQGFMDVRSRISYVTGCMMYKVVNDMAPLT